MYLVKITNDTESIVIHDTDPDSLQKLASGSISEEINVIPEFIFSIFPQVVGYDELHPLTTIVEVYNTKTCQNDFEGRLLKPTGSMKKDGKIAYKWKCEGFMAYLMDTVQDYHHYENTDVPDFLQALLDAHNAMTEESKHIYLGLCDIHDTSSKTTAYRRTLEEIRELLINRLGGEIRIRRFEGKLYLDYLTHYGKNSTTKIELERNLQEIEVSTDVSNIITRLVPLGYQLNDETAERLTIADVNDGCIWIDDTDAMERYGTCLCAVQIWDDVTLPENLKTKGMDFMRQNNFVKKHFKLTALDLSLNGLDVEGFTLGDSYETKNPLMNIDDWLRVVKRNINVCEPVKSTMEVGDKTETFTVKSNRSYSYVTYEIPKIQNDILAKTQERASAMITQATKGIIELDEENGELLILTSRDKYAETTRVWRYNTSGWGVSNNGYNGEYKMAATFDNGFNAEFITAGVLTGIEIRNGDDTFHVSTDGTVTASAINITGGSIDITTDSASTDVIQLNYGTWSCLVCPSVIRMNGERGGTYQASYGYGSVLITRDDTEVIRLNGVNGSIHAIGTINSDNNINAGTSMSAGTDISAGGTVSAPTGRFTTLWADAIKYKRDDGQSYDLNGTIKSMQANIQTLWDKVFG